MSALSFLEVVFANPAVGFCKTAEIILPLPKGEGRGEGKQG
jgi:hypothetical protein